MWFKRSMRKSGSIPTYFNWNCDKYIWHLTFLERLSVRWMKSRMHQWLIPLGWFNIMYLRKSGSLLSLPDSKSLWAYHLAISNSYILEVRVPRIIRDPVNITTRNLYGQTTSWAKMLFWASHGAQHVHWKCTAWMHVPHNSQPMLMKSPLCPQRAHQGPMWDLWQGRCVLDIPAIRVWYFRCL